MLRLQQTLPTPNGVQPNGTGSLNLPLGRTYYSLSMDISDGANITNAASLDARIQNIRLKLNGTVVRQYNTMTELININQMHGIQTLFNTTNNTARVVFYFAEPQRRTPLGEDIFAWQCYEKLGINSFNIEFDITSTASASINVQMSCDYAQLSAASLDKMTFGNIIWHSSQLLPNDGAGLPTISTLQRTAYTRIHAYAAKNASTQVLAGAKVKVNDLIIREFRSYYEYQAYMFANGLNTIENWLTIPFDETNRYDELLDLRKANSFVIEYSTAAANSITLLLEELKGL